MADEGGPAREGWRKLSRRELVKLGLTGSAAGAVGLGLGFFGGLRWERYKKRVPPRAQPFSPSVFLAIDGDGATTIWVTRAEMGQGVRTALPMIVAEELEADWSAVRIEQAPASRSFGNQTTVASASVRSMFGELRRAGAIARAMLVSAAADTWEVDRGECRAMAGTVVHEPTGRRLGYGTLAAVAGALEIPDEAPLKPPSERRLLGRPMRRLDTPEKTDGSAVFGLDVRRPRMCFASIERCPEIGGSLASFDDTAARAVDGVIEVHRMEAGLAVIAQSTWAAFQGREALEVQWRSGPHAALSTETVVSTLRERSEAFEAQARDDGDVDAALASAARTLEALYEVPYLAHVCMEPINATARVHEGRCEVWAPTQDPQGAQQAAAEITGLSLPDCHVHPTLLGGGFGRRSVPQEVREAVELATHLSPRPVQVAWRREDDVRHDYYRHATAHRFEVGLDADGRPVAWRNRMASPSMQDRDSAGGEVDDLAVEGARDLPYAVPNVQVWWSRAELPLSLGIWRSVGHSYNAFAVESMIDEVAAAAGRDPIDLRLSLLGERPAHRALLERVREASGWDRPAPEGRARGVAIHACYESTVAQVAEVSVDGDRPRVHRVWAVIDCGQVINPDTVEAQIEGGVAFGLSAALHGRIDLENGRVVQSNFHDYPILRIDEMPAVEVAIVESERDPGGVGELGVPPIAPAVCNALFALTGRRVRRLPITLAG